MFAILIPVSLSPLILTLLWAERKARKLNIVPNTPVVERGSFVSRALNVASQLDVVGLTLLGASVALILLPLTLANNAKGRWHNRMCCLPFLCCHARY